VAPDPSDNSSQAGQDPWLTLAEIARELRVSPATVRLWVSQGRLAATRAGARKWLVRRSELERMIGQDQPSGEIKDSVGPVTGGGDPFRPPTPGDRLIVDTASVGSDGADG
jgi:excisionase family DNA binding protein